MVNEYFDIINQTDFDIKPYITDFESIYNEIINLLNIKEQLEVALTLVDDQTQLNLNKNYRQKDYIADVLTFALEQDPNHIILNDNIRHLGDIFICIPQAQRQAKLYEHSLRRELAFLFTHGMLHILGYDHMNVEDEKIMFSLQDQILTNLKIERKL